MKAEAKRRSSFEELHKHQPPIVGGQAHLEMLRGLVSKGSWDEIDKILARQTDNAVKYWKAILGWKRRKGGRPPGPSTRSKTFEPLNMVLALLPRFKEGMALKREFSRKFRAHRRSREGTEAELLKRGFSKDEVYCLILSQRSPVSAVIAFVSDQEEVGEDTLRRAYYRRLHSKAGYGGRYGASYGAD